MLKGLPCFDPYLASVTSYPIHPVPIVDSVAVMDKITCVEYKLPPLGMPGANTCNMLQHWPGECRNLINWKLDRLSLSLSLSLSRLIQSSTYLSFYKSFLEHGKAALNNYVVCVRVLALTFSMLIENLNAIRILYPSLSCIQNISGKAITRRSKLIWLYQFHSISPTSSVQIKIVRRMSICGYDCNVL